MTEEIELLVHTLARRIDILSILLEDTAQRIECQEKILCKSFSGLVGLDRLGFQMRDINEAVSTLERLTD